MYRIDDATAATSLPVPEAAATEGYFTEGNPVAGTPATKARGSWLNMIQEELASILAAAGIPRVKTTYNQVNAALQKMYSPVVGTTRNLIIDIPTASASATVTADEIVVETALGGQTYKLAAFNKTINISTVGVGGMDVAGLPATANVAIYAIFNPTTGASALLGFNATSKAPEVYGGSAMPAGYTASALLTVMIVQTSQFFVCYVQDRHVTINQNNQISTSIVATNALLSLGCPTNSKNADLNVVFTSSSATNANVGIGATSAGSLGTSSFQVAGGSGSGSMALRKFALRTGTSIWYTFSNSAGTPTLSISLVGYDI